MNARFARPEFLTGVFIAACLLILPAQGHAGWQDITQDVYRHTNLDEKIQDACRRHCQGNRRKGTLRQVAIARVGRSTHRVWAWASFKNHHHVRTLLGGGFAAYEYTIDVEAYGTLDENTCNLRIDDVEVHNDQLGIGDGARKERGKVHHVSQCHRLVR